MTKHDYAMDFGTTYTLLSPLDNFRRGNAPVFIPSYFTYFNGIKLVGDELKEALKRATPEGTVVHAFKNHLGVKNKMKIGKGSPDLDVCELGKEYFRKIFKEQFDLNFEQEGVEPGTILLSTPVRFSHEQRQVVRDIFEKEFGFQKVLFVFEPTAALIGADFGNTRLEEDGRVLVVDWGGGTLDLSVVEFQKSAYREINIGGDASELGGHEMDMKIARDLLKDTPRATRLFENNDRFQGVFLAWVEGVKERALGPVVLDLGGVEFEEDRFNQFHDELGSDIEADIYPDREMIRMIAEAFVRKGVHLILGFIEDTPDLKREDISHILFAGGVCHWQELREKVGDHFKAETIMVEEEDRQKLTGLGCLRLLDRGFELQLASDFGIFQHNSQMAVLIKKGRSLNSRYYRYAEFEHVHPDQSYTIVDMGFNDLLADSTRKGSAFSYQSRDQFEISTGREELSAGRRVGDIVRVYVGLHPNLTLHVLAFSNRGMTNGIEGSRVDRFISAVPLRIVMRGGPNE